MQQHVKFILHSATKSLLAIGFVAQPEMYTFLKTIMSVCVFPIKIALIFKTATRSSQIDRDSARRMCQI